MRSLVKNQRGMTLLEVVISLALFGLIVVGFSQALSAGIRGTELTDQRSTGLNLARAQLESIKSQSYVEPPTAYATITPPYPDYTISINGTVLTPGFLEKVTVAVSYPRGSLELSGYKVNHVAPVYAETQVPAPPPTPPPGVEYVIYYLHNYPTPPTGNTNSQANLPLNTTAPAAYVLYNYDQNRDGQAGLLIAMGGSGAAETDLTKYQNWRMGTALGSNVSINGTVEVRLWSAIKNFQLSKAGEVKVFLRDWSGSSYTEIANGTLYQSDWQAGWNTFAEANIQIPGVNYTLLAGHYLEVKVVVGANSADDMWFAYDTDRDALPGLYLVRAPAGGNPDIADTTKFQDWRMTATLSSGIVINGQTSLFLYGAATGFATGRTMTVDAWLRDFDPATGTYTTISRKGDAGFVSQSTWTAISVHFSKAVYTVPAGHKLALKIQFDGKSDDEGMIAYDTTSYLAFLLIPTQP